MQRGALCSAVLSAAVVAAVVLGAATTAGCEGDAAAPCVDGPTAPTVDEGRVIPQTTLIEMDLRLAPEQAFSLEQAASDADGDTLHRYWYLLTSEDQVDVAPYSDFPSFTYRPCDPGGIPPLPPGDSVPVFLFLEVDVTDRPRLTGDRGAELAEPRSYPVDAHVVTLDWVLALRGVCPTAP